MKRSASVSFAVPVVSTVLAAVSMVVGAVTFQPEEPDPMTVAAQPAAAVQFARGDAATMVRTVPVAGSGDQDLSSHASIDDDGARMQRPGAVEQASDQAIQSGPAERGRDESTGRRTRHAASNGLAVPAGPETVTASPETVTASPATVPPSTTTTTTAPPTYVPLSSHSHPASNGATVHWDGTVATFAGCYTTPHRQGPVRVEVYADVLADAQMHLTVILSPTSGQPVKVRYLDVVVTVEGPSGTFVVPFQHSGMIGGERVELTDSFPVPEAGAYEVTGRASYQMA